jgi:hypothetical protein
MTLAASHGKTYPVGSGPTCVAVGDFNNDGYPDLVTANFSSSNVSILFGRSNGSFGPAVNLAVGHEPSFVLVGDFNNDQNQDLAVSDSSTASTGTVYVMLGNGHGKFKPPVPYAVARYNLGMVAADFNLDGNLDLAVAAGNSNSVSVLLGKGDGTFGPPANFPVATTPYYVATADLNADGIFDLITSGFSGVTALLGNGDGTFQAATTYGTFTAGGIGLADFNGDGIPDIAVTLNARNSVGILLGNSFQSLEQFPAGKLPVALATADLNGDGNYDLVTANDGDNSISVLYGNGDGTFQPAVNLNGGARPSYIALLTVNHVLSAAVADEKGNDVFVTPLQ